jgi:soluble lytic murein transglycosylase
MYDPESNINFGCWYLNYLASLFHGDPVCVACAYHAGQGQVTAWLSDTRYSNDGIYLDLSRMSDGPTKTYAERVIRAYGIYQALYYNHLDVYDVLLPRPGQ